MVPILYHHDISPPARSVRTVAAYLNIPLDLRVINLLSAENCSDEFLKINPQHTLPVLDDDGFIIWESAAIIEYMIDKFIGENITFFPKGLRLRAVLNQRQHFNSSVLFAKARQLYRPVLSGTSVDLEESVVGDIKEAYGFLEAFLENDYLVGKNITVPDFTCATSVAGLAVTVQIEEDVFPKLKSWFLRVTNEEVYVKINAEGHRKFVEILSNLLGKDKIQQEIN